MSTRDHQQIPDQLSPWPSLNTVDYFYNPHYGIRFVILTWSQIILEEVHMGYSKAQKEKTHKAHRCPVRMLSRRKVRFRSSGACWPATSAAWWLREVTANLKDRSRPARWRLSGLRERCRGRRN